MADISDETIDFFEKAIEDSIKEINSKIDEILIKLPTTADGRLERMELARLRSTRKQIAREFAGYNETIEEATRYNKVTKAIKDRLGDIDVSFTQTDRALLKILSDSSYRELAALGDEYIEKVNGAMFKGIVSGSPKKDIQKEITQLLEGGTDLKGRSLSSHAKTITNTRYMEADATMTLEAADNIGAKHFRYSGSLIKDSRQWCKDHVDKIYTRAEVEAWRDQTWGGKKEGDPFVTRGGWNCRHYFVPVIKED